MESQRTASTTSKKTPPLLIITASIALFSSGMIAGFTSSLHLLQTDQHTGQLAARSMIASLQPILNQLLNSSSFQEAFIGDLLEELLNTEERMKTSVAKTVGESFGQFFSQLKEIQTDWNSEVLANLTQHVWHAEAQLNVKNSKAKEELIERLQQQMNDYKKAENDFSERQETILASCHDLIHKSAKAITSSLDQQVEKFSKNLEAELQTFTDGRTRADTRLRKTLELLAEKIKSSNKETATSLSSTASKLAAELLTSQQKAPNTAALLWELYGLENGSDANANTNSSKGNPFFN
jgi:hypothetical protein